MAFKLSVNLVNAQASSGSTWAVSKLACKDGGWTKVVRVPIP
ncbi:MAG TPA: hypothetical protein VIT89_06035 [Solirubrobacterales bacterium]